MDYMDLDLRKLIQNNCIKNFNIDQLKTIFYNLLCSITFIHSAGIMHRDLKPGNVLIDKQCFVRICDFGMSRSICTPQVLKKKEKTKTIENESTSDDEKKP